MSQTIPLINALKQALKGHNRTYADVAKYLRLSEASIKRMFSEYSLSLQRLDQICQMMDMEISELVQLMNQQRRQLTALTAEQEKEIASDLSLLLVTVCVLNKWSLQDIINHYQLSENECVQLLAKLDKLHIIELLPKNKIKLLVSTNFNWLENGPIQQFFQKHVEKDFFDSRFDKDEERLLVVNGMLTKSSNAMFQRKMERLIQEFNELNDDDAGLPIAERDGNTVVVAIRQWQYGLFANVRR